MYVPCAAFEWASTNYYVLQIGGKIESARSHYVDFAVRFTREFYRLEGSEENRKMLAQHLLNNNLFMCPTEVEGHVRYSLYYLRSCANSL